MHEFIIVDASCMIREACEPTMPLWRSSSVGVGNLFLISDSISIFFYDPPHLEATSFVLSHMSIIIKNKKYLTY